MKAGISMKAGCRNRLRMAVGLPVAAALVTAPLWWEAAAGLVRSGPLAPTWPWLVPALSGALVVALTVAPLRASRRLRLERRMDRFERSFLRRLAATGGVPEPNRWRGELAGLRGEAGARLDGSGRRQRGSGHGEHLLEARWRRIAAALAERERGGAAARAIPVADLVEAAMRDAVGTDAVGTDAVERAAASPRRAPAAMPPAPSSLPRRPGASEGRAPAPAAERGSAPVDVLEEGAFAEAVQQVRESVALEGGVYRVREQVYGAPTEPRRSLRRLAESVITDDKIARLATAGQRRQVRTRVTDAGVDYDQLLAQSPDVGARDVGAGDTRGRVLEEQRAALAAHAAVLLVERDAGYTAVAAAGSPDSVLSAMALGAGDRLYDEHLRARRCVLGGPGSAVCGWLPFAADRMALLPATLDGGRAYLLFAASMRDDATVQASGPWTRETLVERLNLHP